MSKIWPWIICISIVIGIYNGKAQELTTCIFDSAKSSVETCLKILGIICLWGGFMKIAEKSGLLKKLSQFAFPLIHLFFPELKKDNKAVSTLAMNMTANLIGLGNIATPMGLKAMSELQEVNIKKDRLSKSMMTLLALNMASIQLIPTTVIALRTTYDSNNSAEIVAPVIIASFSSALIGVFLVRLFYKK